MQRINGRDSVLSPSQRRESDVQDPYALDDTLRFKLLGG
jgi:hypothetical protein